MALAGIGVDMLEIARMRRALDRTPGFATRIFTDDERTYCDRCAHPAEHYAARFAAREAVLKALGTGFSQGIGLKDVSVAHDREGRPTVVLSGRAREVAREQGVQEIALSLSFTRDVAVANAVCVTDEVRPKKEEKPDARAELQRSFREARGVIAELERMQEDGGLPDDGPGADAGSGEAPQTVDRLPLRDGVAPEGPGDDPVPGDDPAAAADAESGPGDNAASAPIREDASPSTREAEKE